MIWEKAQEHETRLGFNALRAKATILLHCLIKFINWIRCLLSIQTAIDFISEGILGDAVWVMCAGVRWWKNMKVYGVFCCCIVLPYGFYSSFAVGAWWERYMRDRCFTVCVRFRPPQLLSHTFSEIMPEDIENSYHIPSSKHTQCSVYSSVYSALSYIYLRLETTHSIYVMGVSLGSDVMIRARLRWCNWLV